MKNAKLRFADQPRVVAKLFISTSAFIAASPLWAADAVEPFPVPQHSPATIALPVDMWAGAYAGVTASYVAAGYNADTGDGQTDDVEAGVFFGVNRQIGSYVFGAEGDAGLSGLERRLGENGPTAEKSVFGSLRGRAGVSFDPVMIYATAGLAAAQTEVSNSATSDEHFLFGYTVGAGVDAALTQRMFGRLEYRFSEYRDETFDLGDTTITTGFDEHAIRAGVGLKF